MIFEVDGDVTGLKKALSTGSQSLVEFGKESEELFGGFTKSFTDLTERFSGFNTGILGVAGAAGLLAGGIYSAIDSSNEFVKTYNEVSKASGLTVTELQQLQKTFQGVGLDVEKFGDINRDTLDHLGDAFRDGSGPAEDLKTYGVNLQDFNKYLNQTDGGIKSLATAFYTMQKAGKNNAEITNALETMASDGSKLISTFQQYNSVADLMNAIHSQTATLTDENAQKFAEWDAKVSNISTTFQLWKANALAPTLDDIQTLFDLMNKDWSKTDFVQMFKNFYYGGDNGIARMLREIDGVDASTIPGTKEWNAKHADNNFPPKPTVQNKPDPTGGYVNQAKVDAANKAAAAKAEAAAKQAAAKRVQAQKNLEQAVSQIGLSEGDIRIKTFNRQQDELVQKIKDSAKTLQLSEAQTTSYLTQAYDTRTKAFKKMIDDMIGYSDPNSNLRQLSDNIAAIGSNLSTDKASWLQSQQDQRVGITGTGNDEGNPWDNSNVLDQKKQDLLAQQQLELTINEQTSRQLGLSQEQYLKRKQALQESYNKKILAVETDNTKAQMDVMSGAAGDLGTILSGAFGEGSKAAEAAFALQKGIQIAQIMMNIQTALSSALATPFPASLAAYAQVLSLGASIITTAKGTASGKAHSGIDSVPGSGDQTWILKGGERVVQPEANRDLTQYLNSQKSHNQSTGQQMVVNAPLVVQGSVDDDARFQSMLKKHQNSVVQAVKNAQSRNS